MENSGKENSIKMSLSIILPCSENFPLCGIMMELSWNKIMEF